MRLTVLSVPDCPNAPVLLDRLQARVEERVDDLRLIVITDDELAHRWGMTGSPTLLLDGVDPFATPGATPSIACRLYRRDDASVAGAPSETDLDAALDTARAAAAAESPDGGWIDAVSRAGQGRRAPSEGGLRAVQAALIRGMAEVGQPPGAAELDRVAAAFGRRGPDILRELAVEDYLTLDDAGRPRAIYPFAVAATRHKVRIAGGPEAWAMCAIDALGMAPMLDQLTEIDTTDPLTTEPISIRATAKGTTCDPPDTVVLVGRRSNAGPAERICCDAINFFGSGHSAARWLASHPDVRGQLLDIEQAMQIGREIFGDVLAG